MERIFNNSNSPGILANIDPDSEEAYEANIKALIYDALDHEESDLAPARETNLRYYDGIEPMLPVADNAEALGDEAEQPTDSRSTIVSTDVRDTVLSIMPSLMRIFGNSEHALEFVPRDTPSVDLAAQATDYIRYKIWTSNDGYFLLYDAFHDALVSRVGVVTWGTETADKVSQKVFSSLTQQELGHLLQEAADQNPQVVAYEPPVDSPDGPAYQNVKIRYNESKPHLWISGIPPENFRISRGATSVKTADCVGYEEYVRVSDLVVEGFDFDVVSQHVGEDYRYTTDFAMRHPGTINYPLNDMVLHGRYFVRIDSDNDGINELHEIHTIGADYEILSDDIVDDVPMALFTSDRRPHSAVGRAFAELILDIQRIKTNLERGQLDTLAQSIFPRTAVNELMTNMEDVMSDDIGAPIRTRGNVMEAVAFHTTPYLGEEIVNTLNYMDGVRYQRTGVNDASKGLDPKAFQSTNMSGIDAIVAGSQERIELIAQMFAHSGMRDLYLGLLKEVTNNPNRGEVVKLRGKFVAVDPSLFDPDMTIEVNPAMGKGTDANRLVALQAIGAAQMTVIEKFGLGNGVVGVEELRNTQVDIMSIVNIKNHARYFREIDPKMAQQMETAPKDPDAATLLAQAQLEKVKADTVKAISQKDVDLRRMDMDDDFRRDQLNVNAYLDLMQLTQQGMLHATDTQMQIEEMNQPDAPDETAPSGA